MAIFIVLEVMDPNYPVIVTNEDGHPMIFDDWEEAEKEADECQNGKIVEIN